MKRFAIVFLCCIGIMTTSCSRETSIYGKVEGERLKGLNLYTFNKGDINVLSNVEVGQEATFRFTLDLPYEGIYLLGENDKVLFPVYLKKGDQINLLFTRERLIPLGEQSAENKELFLWEEKAAQVRLYSYLYDYIPRGRSVKYADFFQELSALSVFQKELLTSWSGKKGKFYSFLKNKIEADLDFYALSYLRFRGATIPDTVALPEYYWEMKPDLRFQNLSILDIPYGGIMLETYVWYLHKDRKISTAKQQYEIDCLQEKALQQEYLVSKALNFKYFDQYRELLDQVGEDFFSNDFKQRLKKIEEKLAWSAPGQKAPDFKGMKQDSTWLALSDFRGKVVVVDVWATWCAPCKRMMPYFQQLEKEMKDKKDVVFISVCIGVSLEWWTWLDIIKQLHLEGNQCFGGNWLGEFAKNYKITGVPRYMVFDRSGRIVSVAAPNPTTPALRELIEETLKK